MLSCVSDLHELCSTAVAVWKCEDELRGDVDGESAAMAAADAVASRASTSNDQIASQTWSDDDSDVEGALVAHSANGKRVGPDEICGTCGGRGHHSKVGNMKCLTIVLGNNIPKEELHQTKYPRGLKYPNFHRGAKAKFSAEEKAKIAEAEAILWAAGKKPRSSGPNMKGMKYRSMSPKRGKKKGQRPKFKPKARVVETSNDPDSADSEQSESSDETDDETEVNRLSKHTASLAIDYGAIMTPPPSPPASDESMCLACEGEKDPMDGTIDCKPKKEGFQQSS